MAKINLNNITNPQNVSMMNANFQKIAVALDEQVLYRDNPDEEPNQMENDIDMNGKRIYNLPEPLLAHEAARLKDVQNSIAGATQANLIQFTPTDTILSTNVQAAIEEVAEKFGGFPVKYVDSIEGLRSLTDEAGRIITYGYYVAGDGGGSNYYADLADTTSADNGSTVIVSANGTRWKLRHSGRLDVRQFGAKGDGVSDDTAILNSAATVASTLEAQLWWSAGTYIISSEIVLNNLNNVNWDGVGVIKLKDNATPKPASMLLINTSDGLIIKGITVDGNRANNVDHGVPDGAGNQGKGWQGTLLALVNTAYMTNFLFENITIQNAWGSGMWLTDCEDGKVVGCRVKDYRITGIAVRNNSADPRNCRRIQIVNNTVSGGIVGIHFIFGAFDCVATGNICFNNKDQNRFLPSAYSGTYPNVWPSTGGFTAFGSPGYVNPALVGDGAGIECTGVFTDPNGTSNFNLSLSNNTCNSNAVGVRLEEVTTFCAVEGNTCRENDFYGILLLSAFLNSITGNVCSSNGLDGIRIEKVVGAGLQQSANNTVVSNVSVGNQRYGLVISGSQGTVVSANNFSGNGGNTALSESGGIGLYASDGINVERTQIIGNNLSNYFGTDKYAIFSNTGANVANSISLNNFSNSYVLAKTNISPELNYFSKNNGFATENKATAILPAGQLFIDVIHGLDIIPQPGSVQLTPVNSTTGFVWWVQAVTSTNFRIQVNVAPAGDTYFYWNVT